MPHLSRRSFLKTATVAAAGAVFTARSWSQVAGENIAAANQRRSREYRAPWIVPQLA